MVVSKKISNFTVDNKKKVGLGEKHPLECRLQPALYFFIRSIKKFPTHKKENTEIIYVEQIHLELYGPPGFLNNQFPSVGKMNSYYKYLISFENVN